MGLPTTTPGLDGPAMVEDGRVAALWGAGMGVGLGVVRLLIKERGRAQVFLIAVVMCGAILIVMMNARPQGLLGTRRVEIV